MNHRVFIAINLPENTKEKLLNEQEKWSELPARWARKDNVHVTLVFLGYVSDQDLIEICKTTEEVAVKHQPFSVNLTNICYAPPKKIPPSMVWATGEGGELLGGLQKDLENALLNSGGTFQSQENRPYIPHITLARIRKWEWRRIEPDERIEVDEDISLNFEVNSIEVMESKLKKGGPEYIVLESAQLGD